MADQNFLEKILSAGTAKLKQFYKENPALHKGQAPKVAVIGCSDSRVPTDLLFNAKPGDLFTYRNIGNSLENEANPHELGESAKAFITYANHIGVETLVVLAHGRCGCIANACSCANTCGCKDHGHGDGLEAKILKQMGDEKRFAVNMVNKDAAVAYLCEKGMCESEDTAENHPKSIEIAHGQHMVELAKAHLKSLNSSMKVVLAYFDVATCDTYVLGEDGKFKKMEA